MESQHHHSPHQNHNHHSLHMLPHEFVNDTFFDHKPAWHYRLEKDQLAPPESSSELTRNASVKSTSSQLSSDSGYSTVPPSSTADPYEQPESPWSFDLFLADNPYGWRLPPTTSGSATPRLSTEIVHQPIMKPTLERRPHTKIRRGCNNCARSRVKCQESKPACGHCVTLGINCEYPVRPQTTHQRSSSSKPLAAPIAIECIDPDGTVVSAHSMDSGIEVDNGRGELLAYDQFPEDWPEYGSEENTFQDPLVSGSPSKPLDHRTQNEQQDQVMHDIPNDGRAEGPSNGPATLPLTPKDDSDDTQLPDADAYEESVLELRSIMANADPLSSGDSSLVSTRVPSPWQQAATLLINDQDRINEHLHRSLEWVLNKYDDDDEPTHDTDPESSRSTTPTHRPAPLPFTLYESADNDKKRILNPLNVPSPESDHSQNSKRRKIVLVPISNASGDDSGQSDDPGSAPSHQHSDRQPVSQNRSSSGQSGSANSVRRANNGPHGRRNEDDEAGNRPPRPPGQPISPPYDSMRQPKRQRYACPYNKWDPIGCQLCCMPSRKNPEGGAEVFSRVKSHIFRNHDISVRCQRCWASFPTKSETLEDHVRKKGCMRKASPTKYWMSEDQRRQVRGQRFVGSGEENWYHLFRILLPDVPLQDEHGGYILTPYYVPLAESRTPSNLSGPASQAAGSGIPLPASGTQTPNSRGFNHNSLFHLSNTPHMGGELPAVVGDTWSPIPPFFYDADVAVIDDPLVSITSHPNEDAGIPPIDPYPTPRTRRQSDESGESGSSREFSRGRINSGNERQSAPQDPSSTFLKLDNERLRQSMRQVRGERDDMRRRMEAANSRVDLLEQLLEDALYEEGKSSKLCSKLFELSKTLVDLRKELG